MALPIPPPDVGPDTPTKCTGMVRWWLAVLRTLRHPEDQAVARQRIAEWQERGRAVS